MTEKKMQPTLLGRGRVRWQRFWNSTRSYRAVALGSVIGGVMRYLASVVFQSVFGAAFPWSTLFVNVTGSFVIGFYAELTGPDGRLFASLHQRQFVMIGICGGYTTFSAFSLETLLFVQAGNFQAAVLNIGISVVGWMGAVWIGHVLATRINRLRGS
jgi:fluoride exporter